MSALVRFVDESMQSASSREMLAPLWARSTEWGELTPELVEHYAVNGDALLVTIPDPRWARVLKLIPGMQSTMFPLMSQPLPLQKDLPWNDAYRAYPLTTFDSRIDELGSEVARQYNCTIRRDARRLEWKKNRVTMVVTAVERDGELVGVVGSRKKGDRQWLICDLLVAGTGDALKMSIIAAARVADDRARTDTAPEPLRKVGVLATPRMMPVLEELGFYRDEYDFALAVHGLDPSISGADIAPEHWYVTADD